MSWSSQKLTGWGHIAKILHDISLMISRREFISSQQNTVKLKAIYQSLLLLSAKMFYSSVTLCTGRQQLDFETSKHWYHTKLLHELQLLCRRGCLPIHHPAPHCGKSELQIGFQLLMTWLCQPSHRLQRPDLSKVKIENWIPWRENTARIWGRRIFILFSYQLNRFLRLHMAFKLS